MNLLPPDRSPFISYPNLHAEVYLYGMHTAEVHQGWSCERHLHHMMFELNVVLEGCQTAHVNGTRHELTPGDWIVVPPMQVHSFQALQPDPMRYFVAHIQIADPSFLQLLMRATRIVFRADSPLTARMQPLLSSLMSQLTNQGSHVTLLKLIFEIMALLESYYLEQTPLAAPRPWELLALAIAREIELMALPSVESNESLPANWLERIAHQVGASRRHCLRVFNQAYGMSPRDYMGILRQQEAMQLLLNTEESIEQIAYRIGYQDAQSFVRQFSKWTGMTPGTFRKNQKNALIYLTPLEIQ